MDMIYTNVNERGRGDKKFGVKIHSISKKKTISKTLVGIYIYEKLARSTVILITSIYDMSSTETKPKN